MATAITISNVQVGTDNTTKPTISVSGISSAGIQLSRTNLSGSYQVACKSTTVDGTTYYWTDNTEASTTRPTSNNFSGAKYTWSVLSGNATITSEGLVKPSSQSAGSIQVRLTISDISPLANKTVDYTINGTVNNGGSLAIVGRDGKNVLNSLTNDGSNLIHLDVTASDNLISDYTTYTYNNTTHNWFNGTDNGSNTPSNAGLWQCTGQWTFEGAGASHVAMVEGSNIYYAAMKYVSDVTEDTPVTVRLTLTGPNGFTRTATYDVTLKPSVPSFYFKAVAAVGNNGGGSASVNPDTVFSAKGANHNSTSTTATVTYTATPNNEYTFKEWNTKADGTGTRQSTNSTYTPTLTSSSTNKTSPAITTLYAIFKGPLQTGYYYIGNMRDANNYIDINTEDSFQNGKPFIKGATGKGNSSIWYIEKTNDGYKIMNASTGQYIVSNIESTNANTTGGSLFHLEYTESPTYFTLTELSDGSYQISPKGYDTFFNQYGGPGANIGLYTDEQSSHWKIDIANAYVPAPEISFNNTDNKVTITSIPGVTVYYTTNNSTPNNSSTQYGNSFTQNSACTVKAIAYRGSVTSSVASKDIIKVATPVATQNSDKNVQITCGTDGATIYYKTSANGDYSVYNGPFTVNSGTQIWTKATKAGCINSDESSSYTFSTTINAPSISRVTGTTNQVQITVSGGGTIHYTTDGSDPTSSSPTYSAPIPLTTSPMTIKAINTGWGLTTDVVSQTYKLPCETPVIDIDNDGIVTITGAEGDSFYYTTDGSQPTTDSQKYTAPFTVDNGVTVQAIAAKNGYDNSGVASKTYNRQQVPTPTINIAGDRVWFSCELAGVTYRYTTDGTNPTTNSTSSNGSEITITGGKTIKVIATKTDYSPSEVATKTKASTNHVVYLDFNNGNDSNTGNDASHAKKTWAGAYAKLGFGPNAKYLRSRWAATNLTTLSNHTAFNGTTDADFTNTVDNNIIYLVGDISTDNFNNWNKVNNQSHPDSEKKFMEPVIGSGFFKPVTISGKYASRTYSDGTHFARINISSGKHYLNEDTRFEYVQFYGDGNNSSTDFILNYYDLEMGKGITSQNFISTKEFTQYHHGYKQDVTNTAHLQFYGGLDYDQRFGHNANSELNFDNYLPHPDGYKIIIRSGYFSTISPGSTQWNQYNNLNGAMGSPNMPVKCTILVDIDRAWNDSHKSGVLKNQNTTGTPDCDVAVVIAGVHEGNIYGDMDIIIKSGRIYRVVNGSFGANYFVGNYPADSYFGRANILVDPREPSDAEKDIHLNNKNDLVVINELYGGGLGRFKSDSDKTNQSSTYFYGKSTVTINGGTFLSAIYASGAGGVNGIGDANHHTNDNYIPYWNGSTINYGSYTNYTGNKKVLVKCLNPDGVREEIDLSKTSTRIKIHGGVFGSENQPIEGIFGGGYGFVDKELIDYTSAMPNTQAGSIFAAAGDTASSVTIDGDAVIYGNVYGAGRGDGTYYSSAKTNKTSYNKLGLISGNIDLTIGGNAQILGSVYGAGLGIESNNFIDMARLYGNTTITVKDNAFIKGGIYGGGKNGSIDGNVTLSVLGDAEIGSAQATANVHGGGYGKQTRVNGNVDLIVGDSNDHPVINGDVYGGSALGLTNGESANTTYHTYVTLNVGTINGSLYGGGLGDANNAANVYAPVEVKVYGGSVNKTDSNGANGSGGVYGANNVNGAPQQSVKVDIYGTDTAFDEGQYALFAVYGGGNKANYTYGNGYPKVTVHNCDNSIEYVYGGGNAANVAATDVTIYGGDVIGNVFGGGNGTVTAANVNGNAVTKIYGGTILNVYGGSNSQGTIGGTISVTANQTAETGHSACSIDITNLYGGGNRAASNAGSITIGCADHIGNVYGGANAANITGDITLNIKGGNIDNVFGGNNASGSITGGITVNIEEDSETYECGMNVGNVYGGGNMASYTVPTGKQIAVNIKNGHVSGDVFGGGFGSTATVTGNPIVTVSGGNIGGSVFGGGSLALTTGNTTVNVTGGVDSTAVYGGAALANVSGNTTVNLTGGIVNDVYGGGLGRIESGSVTAIAATVGNATVNIGSIKETDSNGRVTKGDGTCVITGSVFGCNNLNGTPTGNATVNVYKTNPPQDTATYHIKAVYGGGNKAAYDPQPADTTSCTKTTHVEIFTCENSIKDVYGGGNAASTPANHLIIHGGRFDYVFGGGNGKGTDNPGANVGYYTDVDDDTPGAKYGSGQALTEIYDGVINHLFGGSNTKGNIRIASISQLEHTGCDFYIGEAYAAGNEAYMDGEAKMNIGCIPGLGVLYGGSKKASIHNNVQITITNGYYGKIFGGNNESGKIDGTITINIEETGCDYIVIGEVYGGGYLAPYEAPTVNGVQQHGPTINAYSFTKIGKIYGGGYGSTATVTGDTYVNVQELIGTPTGADVEAPTAIGIVGDIFGGGNEAAVIGNTHVNIGTATTVPFVSVTENKDKTVIGANIQPIDVVIPYYILGRTDEDDNDVYSCSGNVYGGGNRANVTGTTEVNIGK